MASESQVGREITSGPDDSRPTSDSVMRIVVDFQDESLEFELPEENLVATWRGPDGKDVSGRDEAVRRALETPSDYPPLRQMVVPGDLVVFALDPTIPEYGPVLAALASTLEASGIERGNMTVLSSSRAPAAAQQPVPSGIGLVVHDPNDRGQIAYLATTKQGRRIYLNRLLADADLVIPVGRIGYDARLGYRGPWSVLFPEMSDPDTIQAFRGEFRDERRGLVAPSGRLRSRGVVRGELVVRDAFPPGTGTRRLGARRGGGRPRYVRTRTGNRGARTALDVPDRFAAELVVVGIGRPGAVASLESLADGLATACRLVQHGGKIVVLSRATGDIGPSLRSLIDADDPKRGLAALRGHDLDADYLIATARSGARLGRCLSLERSRPGARREPVRDPPGATRAGPPLGRQERLVLLRQPRRADARSRARSRADLIAGLPSDCDQFFRQEISSQHAGSQ